MTRNANLNPAETDVLNALIQNARDTAGGDFGYTDEVDLTPLGLTPQQFGGYCRSLQSKGWVFFEETGRKSGYPQGMFDFPQDVRDELEF